MLKGNICAPVEAQSILESLGVVVGAYDDAHKEFTDCLVSDEALEKLNPYWGDFYWSLHDKGGIV